MTEGRKDDTDKVRMDLIPPEVPFALATILTFGARKYTIKYETLWDQLLDAPDVTGIKITTAKDVVVDVTKNNYDSLTLTLLRDKDKIVGIGKNEILTRLRSTPNIGKLIQDAVNEIEEQGGLPVYVSTDSQKTCIKNYVLEDVVYVEPQNTYTLTIVTKQGSLEVSCALGVITDLDFWEMIWKDLKEQFNISKPLNTNGERNWEQGMKWGRVFGALMRHMWCWWGGNGPTTKSFLFKDTDDETSRSHLWHALCCISFLIAYEERQIGEDDRMKNVHHD